MEEGGRPHPLGDQGGSQPALRDTPAMGMDCSDSPSLSQAFLRVRTHPGTGSADSRIEPAIERSAEGSSNLSHNPLSSCP